MSALPTLIHQTAWLPGLTRGLTEQRDVYERLNCKTCDPFTLPSTFTSIFTLIWDTRRLHHTVFSCLEKCELWIYLHSLFAAFIKGGSETTPTVKTPWKRQPWKRQCCVCTKITVEDSVLYTARFSSTKWDTLCLCFRLQFRSKLCFQHFGMLPHAWKWESLNCSC